MTTIETKRGIFSTDNYDYLIKDDCWKELSLSSRGQPEQSVTYSGQLDKESFCLNDDDWWSSKVLREWDIPFYKPIRCEEKNQVCAGKKTLVIDKKKFWLKKIIVRTTVKEDKASGHKKHITIKVTFAVCNKEKAGIYHIINQNNGMEYDDIDGQIEWDLEGNTDDEKWYKENNKKWLDYQKENNIKCIIDIKKKIWTEF